MKQINVKQFFKLDLAKQIEYSTVLSHLKAKEHIKVDITKLTYNDVKSIFKQLSKDNSDLKYIFTTALNITEEDFFLLPIQNFFEIKKYIEDFFVNLKQNEIKLLESISADVGLWEVAGGAKLNEFGDILPLSQLAKIYGGYPFEYGKKSYLEIIYLLRMNNTQSQVDNEFNRLKAKQK